MIVGTFSYYDESDLLVPQFEALLSFCDKVVAQSEGGTEECNEIARAYADGETCVLLSNQKNDRFAERDERGSRERLLRKAVDLGATKCYHTDVDEIPTISSCAKMRSIIDSSEGRTLAFRRYDFWHNAYNYRLSSSQGQEIIDASPNGTTPYIFSIYPGITYGAASIPNFHGPRLPTHDAPVLVDGVKIMHFGYYKKSLIERKAAFYQINNGVTGNVWGENMRVSRDEYLQRWGLGKFTRNG